MWLIFEMQRYEKTNKKSDPNGSPFVISL